MRIPYGFYLRNGMLEINEREAGVIGEIFHYYLAGASLGKAVNMLSTKRIPSPTGKEKWTRASVDHILSNPKYITLVGFEIFLDVQLEKAVRCNIDYGKANAPRKSSRYISPSTI